MCGRITQTAGELPGLSTVAGVGDDPRVRDPGDWDRFRYNGAPSQSFWVIRREPEGVRNIRTKMTWGFQSPWMREKKLRPVINARGEAVASSGMFRGSYAKRRCLVPVDNFFEWRATGGPKQPYAIGLRSGQPFALAGIWSGYEGREGWVHDFGILTCSPNEMMATIHDRMPVMLPAEAYERWLANIEPDPADLLVPFPAQLMRMWPISSRVNSPRNDDPGILEPVEESE